MKVLYIDPMSYNNLAIYDYNLLSNIKDTEIYFAGNILYNLNHIKNISFFPIFTYSKKNKIIKGVSYIFSLLKLIRLINKIKPNIIHIQWIRLWLFDYLFLTLLKNKKYKIIYTAHNALPHQRKQKDFTNYLRYYQQVNAIIVHSNDTKKQIINNFKINEKKIHVIPHGILDLSFLCDKKKVEQIKSKFIKKYDLADKLVFSSLGLQDTYKGSDIIFKVWCENFVQNKNVFLFACGKLSDRIKDDDNINKIKSVENTYVDFNHIDNELFLAILQITDVLLLPYRIISQSGVLLSAINEHIPFLVSEVGALSEPLHIADVGWKISEPNDIELSKKISYIIENKTEIYNKKSNPDWTKLDTYYSWIDIGIKTKATYEIIYENKQ